MNIRPLETRDVAPLADGLARLPLMRRYGRTAEAIAQDLREARRQGHVIVVAHSRAGEPIGLAWLVVGGGLGFGGYLKLLAVVEGEHARGLGARLLERFEQEVVRTGSRHALLLVSDFNSGAQRFYQRHGYARVGLLPKLVLSDVDELVYWKRLA